MLIYMRFHITYIKIYQHYKMLFLSHYETPSNIFWGQFISEDKSSLEIRKNMKEEGGQKQI